MPDNRFVIHSYEFYQIARQYKDQLTFLINSVDESGIVEGIYVTKKPLSYAIKQILEKQ